MAGPWITEHEIKVVEDCMRNGWYDYEYVEPFQKEFATYHGRRHRHHDPELHDRDPPVADRMGITDGDEVICPECTWIATCAAPITCARRRCSPTSSP